MTRRDELTGNRGFIASDVTVTRGLTVISNFCERGPMTLVITVARRAAVEVRGCYCVVNESEFAVPLREQLQTHCVRTGLGGRSHLISQSRGKT